MEEEYAACCVGHELERGVQVVIRRTKSRTVKAQLPQARIWPLETFQDGKDTHGFMDHEDN